MSGHPRRIPACIAVAILLMGALLSPPAQAQTVFEDNFEARGNGPESDAEAARFLAQATFGPTLQDIARLRQIGYTAWLDAQFAAPVSTQEPYLDWVQSQPPVYDGDGNLIDYNNVTDATRLEIWTINALSTPFPDSPLGAQLVMVARLIGARQALGMRRQVFFCTVGNYDTHSYQVDQQAANLSELSEALVAFHAATVELGVSDAVTSFTASDFGRAMGINGGGTDHGWGGHHVVIGDAVRGQRFYGTMPSLKVQDNPDDTGHGQLIPTTAVDQYAATLARWLGVADSDIFPSLSNFSAADLGFMI